jgi:hypothetical protein
VRTTIRIAAHRNLDYALSKPPELPRELRVGQAIAGAAANIEEALQCAESDFAVCRALNVKWAVSTRSRKSFVQISILLARVAPQNTQGVIDKLKGVEGVIRVNVLARADSRAADAWAAVS